MPYESNADVPSHVPEAKRSQWREVWNSAFKRAKDKGLDDKEAEQSAFRQANGVALSEHIAQLLSEVPPGVTKIPSPLAVYMELPAAQKDAECTVVEVEGGVSMQKGCCNLWEGIAGESPATFSCGTCQYHIHPEHSTHMVAAGTKNRLFACSLQTLGEVIDQVKGVYKIPLAYTGTFVKDGERFSITASDLESIVRNFKTKGTGTVNVDYEHASEIPELAKGGAVPASGWINSVTLEQGADGKPLLMGVVEWTPTAKQLIENKEYRFFSPAIDWAATNKETGEPQGATLTSAALTNRPFLEKLPPLLMTEVPRIFTEETAMPNTDTKKSFVFLSGTPDEIKAIKDAIAGKGSKVVFAESDGKFRLRKVTDATGDHLQVHKPGSGEGEAAFGELLGEIFPSDVSILTATEHKDGEGMMPTEEQMNAAVGEALGETGAISMTDVKKHYTAGKQATMIEAAKQGHKLLSETIAKDGTWDKRASRTLLSEGKVSPQQYAAFENAVELVELGVSQGKIHPSETQRKYYLTDAIQRPAEFEAMLKDAKPFVILDEHGLAGTSPDGAHKQLSEHDRADAEVRAYMKEHKVTYTKALKAVTKDPVRGQRMRDEAHSRTM